MCKDLDPADLETEEVPRPEPVDVEDDPSTTHKPAPDRSEESMEEVGWPERTVPSFDPPAAPDPSLHEAATAPAAPSRSAKPRQAVQHFLRLAMIGFGAVVLTILLALIIVLLFVLF